MLYARGHNRRATTLGARDRGEQLAAAIAASGLTERQVAIAAGVGEGSVSELVDVVGHRLSRDRCERIASVLAEAIGEGAPSVADLFSEAVVPAEDRGLRARPPLPRHKRYDGRHFKTDATREGARTRMRARSAAVKEELARIKSERGLLDVDEAAAQLFVHPEYVRQLARLGRIKAIRVRIEASPCERVLFAPDEVRSLRRAWARHEADHPGNLLLDPDEAVARWNLMGWLPKLMERHRLNREDAERLVRSRVATRRKAIASHRRGRKPRTAPPAHHVAWLDAFVAKRAELDAEFEQRRELDLLVSGERVPSDWVVVEAVAADDYAHHPERWSRDYGSPRYPEELDPRKARAAGQRVWEALKPLLRAQRENAATEFARLRARRDPYRLARNA